MRFHALLLMSILASATVHGGNESIVLDQFPAGTVYTNQMISMRDGVRLSTHLFLPAGHETTNYPIVLVRSAYNDWNARAMYANDVVNQSNPTNYAWINTNGYVYVFQDLRGDGESEVNAGFEPRLSENEIHDTYDTVESLATNAWSNGRVGMYGNSGHGMAAYMGWLSKAPHLVVAAPGNTAPNLYEHWSFENGVRRWIYRWLSFRNRNGAVMPEWPRPTLGEYYTNAWWPHRLREGASDHSTILLASDAWHNFFLDSTFETFGALSPSHKAFLVMDHGTHQGDIGLTFKPKPSGFFNSPTFFQILDGAPFTNAATLKYFVMGDARRTNSVGNYYRLTHQWPPPAATTPFYLHADGTLSPALPTSSTAALSYRYHPTNPVPTVGGNFSYGTNAATVSGPLNQLDARLTNRSDILRFETEPFSAPVEITGRLQARLFISTDVEDTLFTVKLVDLYPAEGAHPEYHAIMRESAIMARYWSGFASPSPLASGLVYRLDIDLSSISWLVETNHRIGVHISSSSEQAFEVHPNTYEQVANVASSPSAHNTLHLSAQYPSMIRFPLYDTNLPVVIVSTSVLSVAEGGSNTFFVQLDRAPAHAVTVSVERIRGEADLEVTAGGILVFTESDWLTPREVSLSAAQDLDGVDALADFEVSGPAVASSIVQIQETDDDPWIIATPKSLSITEGATGFVGLVLSRAPAVTVTVTASRISGDADLQILGVTNILFNSTTWSVTQSVFFTSIPDNDAVWGSAVLRFGSEGAFPADISLNEIDDEPVLLSVDFGVTNSIVETHGDWQSYGVHATVEPTPSARTYAVGPSNVVVSLSSSSTLSGRDRGTPSSNTGAMTLAGVYRDLVQTSAGELTVTISNLSPSTSYHLRGWHYDFTFADNAVFTISNNTGATAMDVGRVTNRTGAGFLPTNDSMYRWSAALTSSPAGVLTLKINGGTASGRINGLELEEQGADTVKRTLQTTVNNPAWGQVSPTGGSFTIGSPVTLFPSASTFFHFTHWTGAATGSVVPLLVVLTNDMVITANFAATVAANDAPHWWLDHHGLAPNDSGALSDSDSDGMAAWEEFVAGTEPTNASSCFCLASPAQTEEGVSISWPVASGRWYSIYLATSLVGGAWNLISETASGSFTSRADHAVQPGLIQVSVRTNP